MHTFSQLGFALAKVTMRHVGHAAAAAVLLMGLGFPTPVQAGPTLVFNFTDTQVVQFTAPVGIVTLTQNGANSVNVSVDLPTGFGFVNTGSKTPFTFNLTGALTVLITSPMNGNFITPKGDAAVLSYSPPGSFPATPFGNFTNAIESSAGNGSSGGYFGSLSFTVTRGGGLSTTDFAPGGVGNQYYFAADVANANGNTGSIAAAAAQCANGGSFPLCSQQEVVTTPEPVSLGLLGMGLLGLAGVRMRRRRAAG